MRPDHLAKGQCRIGLRAECGVDAVGAADDERHILTARVAPVTDGVCEVRRGHKLATLVHDADERAIRDRFFDESRLGGHACVLLIFDFDHVSRAERKGPPRTVEPFEVVVDKVALRTRPKASYRDNVNAHQLVWEAPPSGSHIFSS